MRLYRLSYTGKRQSDKRRRNRARRIAPMNRAHDELHPIHHARTIRDLEECATDQDLQDENAEKDGNRTKVQHPHLRKLAAQEVAYRL